jgi:hypothetical protein
MKKMIVGGLAGPAMLAALAAAVLGMTTAPAAHADENGYLDELS